MFQTASEPSICYSITAGVKYENKLSPDFRLRTRTVEKQKEQRLNQKYFGSYKYTIFCF